MHEDPSLNKAGRTFGKGATSKARQQRRLHLQQQGVGKEMDGRTTLGKEVGGRATLGKEVDGKKALTTENGAGRHGGGMKNPHHQAQKQKPHHHP